MFDITVDVLGALCLSSLSPFCRAGPTRAAAAVAAARTMTDVATGTKCFNTASTHASRDSVAAGRHYLVANEGATLLSRIFERAAMTLPGSSANRICVAPRAW